ncbi:MAG: TonB-dependent receptor [Bacteroidales bacterium]|jgi:iron complex outermembrane receptor protein|nr:TonB-dependent receptor [Bacteroidales bacterium]MDY0196784.1 TonB-dependent receptor [Tenuifilaceae bacterium]
MKKLLFLLYFLMLFFLSIASPTDSGIGFKITGKVVDADGQPLVGAVVIVENSLLGSSTTLNGDYSLTLRNPGDYTITASFMGFAKQSINIVLNEDTRINFSLEHQSIMGEEVVVSATRASSQMPIAQTTINAEELKKLKSGFDIPYLLQMVPSVVAISEGGTGVGNSSFRIRGTDMSRINVTVNGVPLNDPESQSVFWVNMPDFANSVDNIQVQRGIGTSTQGAGAFGATVNFQTSTLTPEPFASGDVMAGSFNTFKTSIKAGTGLVNNIFSFESRYSVVKSDGYIDRGWSDHESLFLTGALHTEKSLLRVNFIHGVQHTGITWEGTPSYMLESNRRYNPAGYMGDDVNGIGQFHPNESDNYIQNHYHLIYSHQLMANLSLNLTGFWITGDGYYEQYKRGRKLNDYGIDPFIVDGETIKKVDMVRQKLLKNDFYGVSFSLNYKQRALNTILGGGWNQYNNNHFGNILWTSVNMGIPSNYEWYRNAGDKQDFNFFLKSTYQIIDNLSLFGDVQYRGISYALTGSDDDLQLINQDHNWKFFNPKAGVFYQFAPNHEVFFSIATAHREPSRADIKDAMKFGENNTPKYEQLIDYELGYNLKFQKFSFGANLFYMDYNDQLVLTGKLSDSGYPLMTNVEKSYRMGIEISSGLIIAKWLRWDANFTLSENKIDNFVEYVELYDDDINWNFIEQKRTELGSTDISFSPPIVASSQIRVMPIKDLDFTITSKYVGSQYIDNTSNKTRKLDAYFVNDLKVGYKLKVKGTKGISIQLFVNNLFNSDYIANGWVWRAEFNDGSPEAREDGFFPQAGINFMGRLAVDF